MKLIYELFCDRLTGLYDRPIIVCVVFYSWELIRNISDARFPEILVDEL